MSSLLRTGKTSGRKNINPFGEISLGRRSGMEVSVPTHFRCPISLDLMKDPVTLSTGITYDRQSIEKWLELGNLVCPVTNQAVMGEDLIPNHTIRRMIQDWCVANRSFGVERIPTPRIPVTPTQVLEILTGINSTCRRGDYLRCRDLVSKLRAIGKESERNKRCIVSNGAAHTLSSVFDTIAQSSYQNQNHTMGVMEEILSALTGISPLDELSCSYMGSPESLSSIVSILKCGDLAGRLHAVLVVKEIVHSDKQLINGVAKTEGLIEALVKLIKEPIFPQATKASLVTSFYMVLSDEKIASRFVELGLVDLLLEMLVDPEKSISEKSLGVLDGICNSAAGREKALDHGLTVPVLVKKILRVSDMATEFSVSILWKLMKNYKKKGEEEVMGRGRIRRTGCIEEALQVGAFQKLLLLLQVGCSDSTKEKVTDLLKLLNSSRGSLECIDSIDFKGLKRPS